MDPLSRTAAIVLAIGLFAATAGAQAPSPADVATARDLFREAATLAQTDKWEAALDKYERSMALRPSPLTRYSIAVAQSHVGRLVEASENLRTFLQEADADLHTYRSPARNLLASVQPRFAKLEVRIPGDPRGAKVIIDGQGIPAAAVGISRPTNPGNHKVEVRVDGHAPFYAQVSLTDGEQRVILVQFDTLAPIAAPPHANVPPRAMSSRTVGLVVLTAGGGVFAAGAGLGAAGYFKAKASPTSDGGDASTARTLALVGDISMGVGIVAAGIGTYLLIRAPSRAEPPRASAVTISPWATYQSAGLGVAGSF